MNLYLQTKINASGNTTQLIVDIESKTIQRGSFLFNPCFKTYITLSKKDLNTLDSQLTENGFKHLIKL